MFKIPNFKVNGIKQDQVFHTNPVLLMLKKSSCSHFIFMTNETHDIAEHSN